MKTLLNDLSIVGVCVLVFAGCMAVGAKEYNAQTHINDCYKEGYSVTVDGEHVSSFDVKNYNIRDIVVNDDTRTIKVSTTCNFCGKHHEDGVEYQHILN